MYNILVCDDEKDIVAALKIYLTAEGYQVLEAGTGREALDILDRERVDLVLMALVFIAQWFTNLNTAVIILSAAAVGLARGLIRLYGKGENRQ